MAQQMTHLSSLTRLKLTSSKLESLELNLLNVSNYLNVHQVVQSLRHSEKLNHFSLTIEECGDWPFNQDLGDVISKIPCLETITIRAGCSELPKPIEATIKSGVFKSPARRLNQKSFLRLQSASIQPFCDEDPEFHLAVTELCLVRGIHRQETPKEAEEAFAHAQKVIKDMADGDEALDNRFQTTLMFHCFSGRYHIPNLRMCFATDAEDVEGPKKRSLSHPQIVSKDNRLSKRSKTTVG